MQITLNESEIVQAIKDYIGNQGIGVTDKHLEVSMVAGRGANGYSANIEIMAKESIDDAPEKTSENAPEDALTEDLEKEAPEDDALFDG